MVIDCLSGSDGKEGIAKAGSLLCSTYINGDTHGDGKRKPAFTEADMASALKAVGMLGKVTLFCMLCFIYLFSYLSCFNDFIT
jgi:hypothetical protein